MTTLTEIIFFFPNSLSLDHYALSSLLYLNTDKGRYTAMLFVDLKKAFDTVDHENST